METIELSNTEASNWHQMKCHNLNFNHERKLNNFQLQFIAATLIIERLMSEFPNWFKEDSFNCFQALLHCFTFFLWHCVLCSQHLQVRASWQGGVLKVATNSSGPVQGRFQAPRVARLDKSFDGVRKQLITGNRGSLSEIGGPGREGRGRRVNDSAHDLYKYERRADKIYVGRTWYPGRGRGKFKDVWRSWTRNCNR